MAERHGEGLWEASRDPRVWRWLSIAQPVTRAELDAWLDDALRAAATGSEIPLVTVAGGRVVGSTRFLALRPEHRSLEIGWTWLGQDYQRTVVNTEAKLLLLAHAFEHLGCIRVEFKTDARNLRSQQALERIGAVREGVLRQHMIVQGGYRRDSVYFSVIDTEWPQVKQRLQAACNR